MKARVKADIGYKVSRKIKDTLVGFPGKLSGVLNGDNLADVLKATRAKQEKKEKFSLASPPQIV